MSGNAGPNRPPLALKPWLQIMLVLLIIAGGAGAAWIWQSGKPSPAGAAAPVLNNARVARATLVLTQAQLATLSTEPVEQRLFYEEITTEGKISVDEFRATPVFSPYAGRVIAIFGQTGEKVEKGQRLFSVQANEMVQAQNDFLAALNILNKARSQINYAQTVEKRLRDLYESRTTTLRELQVAQNDLTTASNDLKTAEVGVEAVRNRLRILGLQDAEMVALQQKGAINPETMISAPLSGTIIQRKIGPGQFVSSGGSDPTYIIGDLSNVWLMVQLRESDALKVDLGERIRFQVLAQPGKIFETKVNFIGSAVDPATRRILVRADVDNRQALLKPEMYASVKVINDREKASLSIPRSAVIYDGDQATVWVLRDENVAESRKIEAGLLNGNNLEVLAGLRAGERVITRGALFVDRMSTQD